jgi:hypothetical protein
LALVFSVLNCIGDKSFHNNVFFSYLNVITIGHYFIIILSNIFYYLKKYNWCLETSFLDSSEQTEVYGPFSIQCGKLNRHFMIFFRVIHFKERIKKVFSLHFYIKVSHWDWFKISKKITKVKKTREKEIGKLNLRIEFKKYTIISHWKY